LDHLGIESAVIYGSLPAGTLIQNKNVEADLGPSHMSNASIVRNGLIVSICDQSFFTCTILYVPYWLENRASFDNRLGKGALK
jgi:hypothetical protein